MLPKKISREYIEDAIKHISYDMLYAEIMNCIEGYTKKGILFIYLDTVRGVVSHGYIRYGGYVPEYIKHSIVLAHIITPSPVEDLNVVDKIDLVHQLNVVYREV